MPIIREGRGPNPYYWESRRVNNYDTIDQLDMQSANDMQKQRQLINARRQEEEIAKENDIGHTVSGKATANPFIDTRRIAVNEEDKVQFQSLTGEPTIKAETDWKDYMPQIQEMFNQLKLEMGGAPDNTPTVEPDAPNAVNNSIPDAVTPPPTAKNPYVQPMPNLQTPEQVASFQGGVRQGGNGAIGKPSIPPPNVGLEGLLSSPGRISAEHTAKEGPKDRDRRISPSPYQGQNKGEVDKKWDMKEIERLRKQKRRR